MKEALTLFECYEYLMQDNVKIRKCMLYIKPYFQNAPKENPKKMVLKEYSLRFSLESNEICHSQGLQIPE